MKDHQEAALLEYLNKEEELEVLDPKGICSTIQFKAATVQEKDSILYYNFEVQLNPNGKNTNSTFAYQPSVLKIMDKEEQLHLEFIREFETYFVEWMEKNYY